MPKHDYGDGDPCPDNPEHGRMWVLGGRQYCPHVDHAIIGQKSIHPLWGVVDPKQAPRRARKKVKRAE